jgi:hypothetical protein
LGPELGKKLVQELLGQREIEREEALLRAAGSERDREGGGLVACGWVRER